VLTLGRSKQNISLSFVSLPVSKVFLSTKTGSMEEKRRVEIPIPVYCRKEQNLNIWLRGPRLTWILPN